MRGDSQRGFTLLELLIVLAIIGILISFVLSGLNHAKEEAYFVRARKEFLSVAEALALYQNTLGGQFPADVNRDIPPGLENYLSPGNWPNAAWPGSVFDWDNWTPGNLTHDPKEQVYQISVRFCPIGQPSQCRFPQQEWAEDFDINSAVYYCISGPCRSHPTQPLDHPGFCVNC